MWGIRDRFEQKPNETAEAWPLWLAGEGALLVFMNEKEWISLGYPKTNLVLQASMAKCISADDMSMEEEHVKTTQSLLQWVFTFIIKQWSTWDEFLSSDNTHGWEQVKL